MSSFVCNVSALVRQNKSNRLAREPADLSAKSLTGLRYTFINLFYAPSSVSRSPLTQATSIPESRSSTPDLHMHLSQTHASTGYDPQDFISTGEHLSDPSQYPLTVPPPPPPPPPSVTPTHTYFPPPPPPPQSDPYYATYSRQYDSAEMQKPSGFQHNYSTSIYQVNQYMPVDASGQKLVVTPQDVCFDQSGYRQMLGTMMNHLVPPGSQLCQVAKESLRQRAPSMVSVSRSSGSRGKATNDVTAMKEKTPCDICGDVSAGFHCNAYVCEACKAHTGVPSPTYIIQPSSASASTASLAVGGGKAWETKVGGGGGCGDEHDDDDDATTKQRALTLWWVAPTPDSNQHTVV
uniref:Nuclear receptor domain-containing protein n=1 Tax=Mesocestoides corti TaxID=53468 RepID=A0A5K3ERU3_MESCO